MSPNHFCCSVAKSCLTLCNPVDCITPGFPVLHCLPEFAQVCTIESVMLSNHLTFCHPLLFHLKSFPTSVFSIELALCIRWPNYWNFSFCISSSIEYSGMISFRIDWFDLLAIKGTFKSLFQHHNLKP